jgi:iron complex outermembrane receptor protein
VKSIRSIWLITIMMMIGDNSISAQAPNPTPDLMTATLEELMNIEVTSVSKKEEKLFQSAAAIYVITQEEIRRSGLTSIPELLRLAPGLSVARIDGNKWAISARGFNGRVANKLLVLIDGRSVYTPQFSGVYWEIQNFPIEEIERIEVFRGPGGTLWGANAVNGVINVITKHAKDSQGGLVTAGGGSEEQGFASVRYGGVIGANAYYRIYAKYFNRSGLVNADGINLHDWQNWVSGGWRLDWKKSDRDALTLHGNIYDTGLRETSLNRALATPFAPPALTPVEYMGGNAVGRWTHIFSDRSDLALQIYFDRARYEPFDMGERIDTFDADLQHRFALGRQDLIWGLGYRLIVDTNNSNSGTPVQITPKRRTVQIFNGFVQDELTLIKDRLRLTIGSKLEHNDYTGFEVQPNARLLWTPSAHHTVWAAVSRAIKTPSRADGGLRVNISAFPDPDGSPTVIALLGNSKLKSEEVRAYEFGYRVQPNKKLFFDIATFYNFYDHLLTTDSDEPFLEVDPQPAHLVIPIRFNHFMRGETYGMEAAANLNLTKRWRISGGYSYLGMRLSHKLLGQDANVEDIEGGNPKHQYQFHSYYNLARNLELDTALYHVSRLPRQQVSAYTRLDVRFGWKIRENFEFSLNLQNLVDGRRPEYNGFDATVITGQVRRSVYGKATWKF